MKRITLLAIIAVIFTACTTEEYYTQNTYVNSYSKVYTVHKSEWIRDIDPNTGEAYYYFLFEEDRLTNKVFNDGVIQAYLYYAVGGYDTKSPLPYSYYWEDSRSIKREEYITVEFSPKDDHDPYNTGAITFILKFDEPGDTHQFQFEYYDFLVNMMW